jgi:hypothetical protein
MPRGHYDRAKAKAKKEAVKAVTPTPAAKVPSSLMKAASQYNEVNAKLDTTASVPSIGPLHSHLTILTQTRLALSGQMQEHNPSVLQSVDNEIIATLLALRNWRELSYGVIEERKSSSGKSFVSGVGLPIPPKSIMPVTPTTNSPPLPFSPESVQASMDKGFGASAS